MIIFNFPARLLLAIYFVIYVIFNFKKYVEITINKPEEIVALLFNELDELIEKTRVLNFFLSLIFWSYIFKLLIERFI